ncbi:Clc-like protein [Ancylostoma duodenale]|uniref:Clc-like protein n=1 Tax=Ancylostoma duodenale TaxID=51022 RepID=A0A0C2G9L6_9BILA|nr:Clc-like protein [Ancylostoma duodenale]
MYISATNAYLHGLWLDCARAERYLAAVGREFGGGQALHCTYKFDQSASQVIDENIEDIDQNSAAGESEHHHFFVFMAVVGDGIFFFAAHRVDNRFVQGLVGTYEQRIGVAFYLHGSGTLVLMFAFVVSVVASYQILRKAELSSSLPLRELAPLYGSRMRETFA